jgi:hypothetical protein
MRSRRALFGHVQATADARLEPEQVAQAAAIRLRSETSTASATASICAPGFGSFASCLCTRKRALSPRPAIALCRLAVAPDLASGTTSLSGVGPGGIVFPIVLIPVYAVPRVFLIHSFSLIGLLRKRSRPPSRLKSCTAETLDDEGYDRRVREKTPSNPVQ